MKTIQEIIGDPELMEIARSKIEDTLIEFRDGRMSMMNARNGFVVRERDGGDSSMIRLTTSQGFEIGMKAIADHLQQETTP